MYKSVAFFLVFTFFQVSFSQFELPNAPKKLSEGVAPNWTPSPDREAVDTCGPYFNNYVGLVKTTDLYFEELRTGNAFDFNPYAGRGQRFHANQAIEISGLQFYSFQNNPLVDSLMVVTLLYDYDELIDSIGVELARDTVWVTHTAFTPLLVDLEVNSYFDEPVIVSEDYIVALYTSTNDSLKIITNSAVDGDGDGEGVSFAYYNNPVAPSFTGWYATLPIFGPSYDLDYLINPLVRYKLHDDFTLSDDSICPTIVSGACVDYTQVANFSDPHYNRFAGTPAIKVSWNWGDGFQNTNLTTLCHTYETSGTYTITLRDSIRRHDFFDFTCAIARTKTIVVLDSIVANATSTASGLSGSFTSLSVAIDSVAWNFGDGTTSNELNPVHTFPTIGSYDVWYYAYGPCNTDSLMISFDATDAGIMASASNCSFYPNPANDQLTIQASPVYSRVEIVNMLGKTVLITPLETGYAKINTSDLANGTYLVQLTGENYKSVNFFVVRH